ncbi:MAG TPA: acetyl-CoA carboxylase biotin carboxylase subunit, partial [Solibacterales bacterium]|nr:acetyl-CoA carboxylase biotin carboxylase subunit [Bryobacterales bacterium]
YAEDPDNRFFPSPGLITHLERPTGPGVRLDSGVYPGWTVPLDYDPLLAKLAVWGPDRETSIDRMLRALEEYYVAGIKTNIPFFRQILTDEEFRAGRLHTGFIDEFFARRSAPAPPDAMTEAVAVLVAAIHSAAEKPAVEEGKNAGSRWRAEGRTQLFR